MRSLLVVFGSVFVVFSLPFVVMAVHQIATGWQPMGGNVGMLVFFLGTGVGGAFMIRSGLRKGPNAALVEQQILALAASSGGRVTDLEVATRCQVSLADSRSALGRLVEQGAAEILVTAQGATVYAFAGLLSLSEKAAAVDILDSSSPLRARVDSSADDGDAGGFQESRRR